MDPYSLPLPRRSFLQTVLAAGGAVLASPSLFGAAEAAAPVGIADLPKGAAPRALEFTHFPTRFHAFVWRNWMLVPVSRLAQVTGASEEEVLRTGRAMGLAQPPAISSEQQRRSYITVIRRNWHLLPYDQLLQLLAWTPEQMAFTLREDDFLYVKLGNLKPDCPPLRFSPPSQGTLAREKQIAAFVRSEFAGEVGHSEEPLFHFLTDFSQPPVTPATKPPATAIPSRFEPRFCYSYFALYGDPLLDDQLDPYPDGYLAQLAAAGVSGVWLQAVLQKLAPFPWDTKVSAQHEDRLKGLQRLVARARQHGMGVYLYLNEPRAMPLSFFQRWPELKGVVEGDYAALCTSQPDVQHWMTDSVAAICRAVPALAGFFTITASENLSNCWSHNGGKACLRCRERGPAVVIAEVNQLIQNALDQAGTGTRLLAWDWGWADSWAADVIARLPKAVALMSVSEWSMPIERGGIATKVGEYSISTIGPGPRAKAHWALAKKRGLKTMAKIQAGNTWELSAVPYIPALANVAQHAANLLNADVDGLMLGWTLGGYPSPNLEVVSEVARLGVHPDDTNAPAPSDHGAAAALAQAALHRVAERRFGSVMRLFVLDAWKRFSLAFSEFPFDGGLVYNAPMQFGPSNLLWTKPTGYHATMIGFPYDDLNGWRGPYPVQTFIDQFEKVAEGFEQAARDLAAAFDRNRSALGKHEEQNLRAELSVAWAAAVHLRSTANQARFVQTRQALASTLEPPAQEHLKAELKRLLEAEIRLARQLYDIQSRDSRIGFEASNQYYYVSLDLVEKALNCQQSIEFLA